MADLSTTQDPTDDTATSGTEPEAAPEPDDTTTADAATAHAASAAGTDTAETVPDAGDPPSGTHGTAPEPAEVAADPPEPAEVAAGPPEPARRSRWTAMVAGLSVLLVALLVATATLLVHNASVDDLAAQRPVVMDTARRVVLDLTTTSPDTAGQRIESLVQASTGRFRDQFAATSGTLQAMLKEADVTSSSIVTAVGIEKLEPDTATVLVAVTIATTNNQAPQGTVQRPRLAVQLQRDGDRWLASGAEYLR